MLPQPWTASTWEQMRLLAMLRLADGWSQQEVADFIGVSTRSIRRWQRSVRDNPDSGLLKKPRSGRPPKLDLEQTGQVLSWMDRSACEFGFATDRWTAPRVASVIEQRSGVCFSAGYLNDWLRRRGVTPQMPQRQPRERDEEGIHAWVRQQWPRIKKRPAIFTEPLVLQMKVDSCWRL